MKMKMKMEKDPFPHRQSSFYACMGSPSWFPSSKQQQLSKFHLLRSDQSSNNGSRSRTSWREALKRLLKDGKSFYTSKPLTFNYDAVSYSKNFDDGSWKEPAPTLSSSSSSSSSSLRRSFGDFECQVKAC